MEINLSVKIRAGKRTNLQVFVFGTSLRDKTITFSNGVSVSEDEISNWIGENLAEALKKLSELPPKKPL